MENPKEALFEKIAAAPYDQCEAEWNKALQELRLPSDYIQAIQQILSEGGWRGKPNPAAYIRKAAKWCAVRIGIIDSNPWTVISDLNYRDADGNQARHDDKIDFAWTEWAKKHGCDDFEDFETSPVDRVSPEFLDCVWQLILAHLWKLTLAHLWKLSGPSSWFWRCDGSRAGAYRKPEFHRVRCSACFLTPALLHRAAETIAIRAGFDDVRLVRDAIQQRLA